jgi:hypothetical protein
MRIYEDLNSRLREEFLPEPEAGITFSCERMSAISDRRQVLPAAAEIHAHTHSLPIPHMDWEIDYVRPEIEYT